MDIGLIIGIAGLVVTLIGIPVAYVLASRSRQRPDLRYTSDFDVLLRKSDSFLRNGHELTYGGTSVKGLSRTRVAFWNHHGDTIKGQDIVPYDKLRFDAPEGDGFLQAMVIYQSRPQCKIRLEAPEIDSRSVFLGFEFLDAGDGAIVDLIHQSSGPAYPAGTMQGANWSQRARCDLSPKSLTTVAQRDFRRVQHRSPGPGVATTFALATLAAAIGAIAIPILFTGSLQAVWGTSTLSAFLWIAAATVAFLVSRAIFRVYRLYRVRIPMSIVKHRVA